VGSRDPLAKDETTAGGDCVLVLRVWNAEPVLDLDDFSAIDHIIELVDQNLFSLLRQVQESEFSFLGILGALDTPRSTLGLAEAAAILGRRSLNLLKLHELDMLQDLNELVKSIGWHTPDDVDVISEFVESPQRLLTVQNVADVLLEHGTLGELLEDRVVAIVMDSWAIRSLLIILF